MLLYYLTVFYLKLNFKLKMEPKMCNFKNLKKIYQKHMATLHNFLVFSYNIKQMLKNFTYIYKCTLALLLVLYY